MTTYVRLKIVNQICDIPKDTEIEMSFPNGLELKIKPLIQDLIKRYGFELTEESKYWFGKIWD